MPATARDLDTVATATIFNTYDTPTITASARPLVAVLNMPQAPPLRYAGYFAMPERNWAARSMAGFQPGTRFCASSSACRALAVFPSTF